jgi:hypothetical protein
VLDYPGDRRTVAITASTRLTAFHVFRVLLELPLSHYYTPLEGTVISDLSPALTACDIAPASFTPFGVSPYLPDMRDLFFRSVSMVLDSVYGLRWEQPAKSSY